MARLDNVDLKKALTNEFVGAFFLFSPLFSIIIFSCCKSVT